jgi:hypothetical protein
MTNHLRAWRISRIFLGWLPLRPYPFVGRGRKEQVGRGRDKEEDWKLEWWGSREEKFSRETLTAPLQLSFYRSASIVQLGEKVVSRQHKIWPWAFQWNNCSCACRVLNLLLFKLLSVCMALYVGMFSLRVLNYFPHEQLSLSIFFYFQPWNFLFYLHIFCYLAQILCASSSIYDTF